jgi:hypothetical protein
MVLTAESMFRAGEAEQENTNSMLSPWPGSRFFSGELRIRDLLGLSHRSYEDVVHAPPAPASSLVRSICNRPWLLFITRFGD